MHKCVKESSHNILFVVSIVVALVFLISSAYYYDKLNKAAASDLTPKEADVAKYMAMMSMLIAIAVIALLFILYFVERERLVGVHVQK